MSPFLPPEYVPPATKSQYIKPSKLNQGPNRLRILGDAIVGQEGWKAVNGKDRPVRKHDGEPWGPDDVDNHDKIKGFLMVPVWMYDLKGFYVLTLTQVGIIRTIHKLYKDPDWGDPTGYDIEIGVKGSGLEVEYSVTPKPHKAVPKEAFEAWKAAKAHGFDLNRIFDNGDPFNGEPDPDGDISF